MKSSDVVMKNASSKLLIINIKPKKRQRSSKTKTYIEENIFPEKLKDGISRNKYLKEGRMPISFESKVDLRYMSESIQSKLGEDYVIKIPEKMSKNKNS